MRIAKIVFWTLRQGRPVEETDFSEKKKEMEIFFQWGVKLAWFQDRYF